MKKFVVFLLCAAAVFSFTACGKDTGRENQLGGSNAQIPNPFVDLKTVDEAKELTGFDLVVGDNLPEGFERTDVRVMDKKMIELIYRNGEAEIRVRKAKGEDDISGDYGEYTETNTVTAGDYEVSTKGNNGKVNVAVLSSGGYAYSVTANGEGLDSGAAVDLITSIR
jgi:hypothetical protein